MLNNQRVTPGKSPCFSKPQGTITAHTSNAQLDHTGACHTTSDHRFGLTRNATPKAQQKAGKKLGSNAKSWEKTGKS